MPRIGILIVAYNAESTLKQRARSDSADLMAKIDEIFVFDDASSDATDEIGPAVARDELRHASCRSSETPST